MRRFSHGFGDFGVRSGAMQSQLGPLNCPHSALNAPASPGSRTGDVVTAGPASTEAFWQQMFNQVMMATNTFSQGDYPTAIALLSEVLSTGTDTLAADPVSGFACSLGIAAAYRMMALAFGGNRQLIRGSWAYRRAHQIALRFQHLAMVWITHAWEKFARREQGGGAYYDVAYIDESAWPISLQEINVEMTQVQDAIAEGGMAQGHRPRWPEVPHDYRDASMRLGIVSLCAYPPDHVLPRYASSNHDLYAMRHGYKNFVGRERLDAQRPPAWGKIKLVYQALDDPDVDWWLWFDCDTYFMNMTVTLDSLLLKYGRSIDDATEPTMDPAIHMIVAEDHAMLNTGAFFLKSSDWSRNFLRQIWGPDNSVWTDHPWWENAAILWNFLKDNSEKFRSGIHVDADDGGADDMDGIYPPEVRLVPQSEFNSYHPATSHFLHDTWAPGKFAIAFNGVLSNTSPEVIRVLYGNYYALSCELNQVEEQCVSVPMELPWLEDIGGDTLYGSMRHSMPLAPGLLGRSVAV